MTMSLPVDFLVKSTGQGHASKNLIDQLPVLCNSKGRPSVRLRVLMLNCLTSRYSDLWRDSWQDSFCLERWSKPDPRLEQGRFSRLSHEWQWATPLRNDFERRQALVEVDVMIARALGLSLEDLCAMYRIQFPVLRQNEEDTWYDRKGRIVFTSSKAIPGVGVARPEWDKIKEMAAGSFKRTILDDQRPGGSQERTIEYVAPFDRCDREADYATAWKFFDEAGV
jgi:hypothetical protein